MCPACNPMYPQVIRLEDLSTAWPGLQAKVCGLRGVTATDGGLRKNPSRHAHYSHYYDDATRRIVDEYVPLVQPPTPPQYNLLPPLTPSHCNPYSPLQPRIGTWPSTSCASATRSSHSRNRGRPACGPRLADAPRQPEARSGAQKKPPERQLAEGCAASLTRTLYYIFGTEVFG